MKYKLLLLLMLAASAAFSQSGVLDTSFGNGGKVVTSLGNNNNMANAAAVQPDGKVIVGGNYTSNHGEIDFALARFNTDGSLDATFGTEGKVVTSFLDNGHNYSYVTAIYILPGGKFVVVGSSGVASLFSKLAVVRYNADGSIDAGFGTNGKVISGLWPYSFSGDKMVFQADGSFLVTSTKFYPGEQNYDIGIERYTPNGQIDTSFGVNGQVITSFGPGKSNPVSMALRADGKFVIAGTYTQTNIAKIAVAQFNANGTLDTTFDGDGRAIANFGTGTYSESLQVFVAADGKIQVSGVMGVSVTGVLNFTLVHYNANGSLDTTFDTDGMALAPLAADDAYSRINAVVRQADGKFLVLCKPPYSILETSNLVLRRYNANGTADEGFGTGGVVSTIFDTGANEVESAALTPDGKIIAVGSSIPLGAGHTDFAVARYNEDGAIDASFSSDGKATVVFEKGDDLLAVLLVLPDDKLLAVGTSGYRQSNNFVHKDIVLSKYNADGSPDITFGTLGKAYSVIEGNRYTIATSALQADGKIVVSTMYGNYSQTSYLYEILRYNADGSLDTTFGTGGRLSINYTATSVIIQPDGKILVAGDGYINGAYAFSLNRFNANGTLDAGFGSNGSVLIPSAGPTWGSSTVVLQADGKIVMCGTASDPDVFAGAMALAGVRLNANGTIDTTFGTNGKISGLFGDDVFLYYNSFIQPDGKIIIAGRSVGASFNFTTARYTANGILDTTYGNNGSSAGFLSEYRELRSVLLQPDGKFLVGLSKYNAPQGSYDFMLRRFNQDGTNDFDFSEQSGLTESFYNGYDEVFALGLQSDNKIIAAGSTQNAASKDFALARYTNEIVTMQPAEDYASAVLVYPNPVKDMLHIRAPASPGIEIIEYAIYNMQGQEVYKGAGDGLDIKTVNFATGIYNLEIETGKGLINRKFIKE